MSRLLRRFGSGLAGFFSRHRRGLFVTGKREVNQLFLRRGGEKRDDLRKENPCLVSYDQLPEAEKEYDRSTAISTLKVIVKLGFAVQRIK